MHAEPGYIIEKQAIQTRPRRIEGPEDTRRKLTEASEAIARLVRS